LPFGDGLNAKNVLITTSVKAAPLMVSFRHPRRAATRTGASYAARLGP
jgi:hypothetical protein